MEGEPLPFSHISDYCPNHYYLMDYSLKLLNSILIIYFPLVRNFIPRSHSRIIIPNDVCSLQSFHFGNLVCWNNNCKELKNFWAAQLLTVSTLIIQASLTLFSMLHFCLTYCLVRLYYVRKYKYNLFWILTSLIFSEPTKLNSTIYLRHGPEMLPICMKSFSYFPVLSGKQSLSCILEFWNSSSRPLIHKTIHHIALNFYYQILEMIQILQILINVQNVPGKPLNSNTIHHSSTVITEN